MTGLMYYRPDDHIKYIHECLSKIKSGQLESLKWNIFIEKARKSPLPPLSGNNSRSASRTSINAGKWSRGVQVCVRCVCEVCA